MSAKNPNGDSSNKTIIKLPQVPKFSDNRLSTTPNKIKTKRRVLKEEDYLCTLGQILQRDFYPDLARLEAQMDYLTAVEKSDLAAVREAMSRLEQISKSPQDDAQMRNTNETEDAISLAEFQASYTSEDNASFEDLLERINSVKRQKYERIYGAPAMITDDPNRRLLYLPSTIDEARIKLDLADTKTLSAANTRINHNADNPSPSGPGLIDETGQIKQVYEDLIKEYSHRKGNFNISASPRPSIASTEDFEFIPEPRPSETPQIRPGVDATPMMTWGEIASTPLRLASEARKPAFAVAETPKREQILRDLSRKRSKLPEKSPQVETPLSVSIAESRSELASPARSVSAWSTVSHSSITRASKNRIPASPAAAKILHAASQTPTRQTPFTLQDYRETNLSKKNSKS